MSNIFTMHFLYLQKFQTLYTEQTKRGVVDEKAQFEYAWCLVRSRFPVNTKKGISLLEGKCFKNIYTNEICLVCLWIMPISSYICRFHFYMTARILQSYYVMGLSSLLLSSSIHKHYGFCVVTLVLNDQSFWILNAKLSP